MKEKLKRCIPLLVVMPFILGTVGYLLLDVPLNDALYGSLTLYVISPRLSEHSVIIEIARWYAAIIATTAILFVLKKAWVNIVWWMKSWRKDSVAVYSDWDVDITFDKKTAVIYQGKEFRTMAKSHIIMFNHDVESLDFYKNHQKDFQNKNVYIGLKEIDYGLLTDERDVNFFDINGAIARELWKSVGLWRRNHKEFHIVIYGNDPLAHNLLNYGLLLNLFSKEQKIVYNLISDNQQYWIRHQNMKTENSDTICYYSMDDKAVWDVIRDADVVIMSDQISVDVMQTICVVCENGEIYYYSPEQGDIGDYLQVERLKPYGRESLIFTDDNVRRGKLTEKARELNRRYAEKYNGEANWNKLSGFLKWSNISSADYNEILTELYASGINKDVESLAELEHIRWCRFHYLNYWKYGELTDGRSKDAAKKIHTCLVSYHKLSEAEKEKDREIVRQNLKGIN